MMEHEYGVVMPRRLQVEFSGVVQRHTDTYGGEVSAEDIWSLFAQTYLDTATPVRYCGHSLYENGAAQGIRLSVEIDGTPRILTGEGNGPINAAVHALQSGGIRVQVRSYEERSMVPAGEDGVVTTTPTLAVPTAGELSGRVSPPTTPLPILR